MRATLLAICLMALAFATLAQTEEPVIIADSIKPQIPLAYFANPARAIYVDHTQFTGFPERFSNDKADVVNKPSIVNSTRILVTVPLLLNKKGFTLLSSLYYNVYSGRYNLTINGNQVLKEEFKIAFSSIASMSLIKVINIKSKKLVIIGNVAYIGRQIYEPQRVTGSITAMYPVFANEKNILKIGVTGIIDNRAQIPVIPIISYLHKMDKNWTFELFAPSYVQFRKVKRDNTLFHLMGVKLDNISSYYTNSPMGKAEILETRNNYVKAFWGLEKNLHKSIWMNYEMGYVNRFNARYAEPGAGYKDYIIQDKFASNFYFNVGLFVRPQPKMPTAAPVAQ